MEWYLQEKTWSTWRKPAPLPIFPLQIPNRLAWDQNRVSVVTGRQLMPSDLDLLSQYGLKLRGGAK